MEEQELRSIEEPTDEVVGQISDIVQMWKGSPEKREELQTKIPHYIEAVRKMVVNNPNATRDNNRGLYELGDSRSAYSAEACDTDNAEDFVLSGGKILELTTHQDYQEITITFNLDLDVPPQNFKAVGPDENEVFVHTIGITIRDIGHDEESGVDDYVGFQPQPLHEMTYDRLRVTEFYLSEFANTPIINSEK